MGLPNTDVCAKKKLQFKKNDTTHALSMNSEQKILWILLKGHNEMLQSP